MQEARKAEDQVVLENQIGTGWGEEVVVVRDFLCLGTPVTDI